MVGAEKDRAMTLEFWILLLLYGSFVYALSVIIWVLDEAMVRAAWKEVKRWFLKMWTIRCYGFRSVTGSKTRSGRVSMLGFLKGSKR